MGVRGMSAPSNSGRKSGGKMERTWRNETGLHTGLIVIIPNRGTKCEGV